MTRPVNILWIISLVLLFTPAIGTSQPRNAGDAEFLSPLEHAVVSEINKARTAPKDYASLLEQYKKYYDKKTLKLPGETSVLTKEGVGAVVEAIRYLRSVKPVFPLNASKGMSLGAKDHVRDQGPSGFTQHKGSDGSQAWDRVNRYGVWEKTIAGNIAYGRQNSNDRDIFDRRRWGLESGAQKEHLQPGFSCNRSGLRPSCHLQDRLCYYLCRRI